MTQTDNPPAFPRPYKMSLLDYFAAHAPSRPDWFEGSPKPITSIPSSLKWCDGCKADDGCDGNADCEQLRALTQKRLQEQLQNKLLILVQWRFAYATAMIEVRKGAE